MLSFLPPSERPGDVIDVEAGVNKLNSIPMTSHCMQESGLSLVTAWKEVD